MSRVSERLDAKGGPLLGVSVCTVCPEFVEMAGMMGFDIAWVEMEHMAMGFRDALGLCRVATSVGMLSMIRIPDASRENVLRAAECGPDIIDLPMSNTRAIAEQLVSHARYAPMGDRGFFGGARSTSYGVLGTLLSERERVNRELALMVQIETAEAVDNSPGIAAVHGIDIVFVGRGDLSASLGVTGETEHPKVMAALDHALAATKAAGKLFSTPSAPGDVGMWAAKGVDLLFCANDIVSLRTGAASAMEQALESLERARG
jgi:4-hydroxy-2-oxoheptanedioate aldolase